MRDTTENWYALAQSVITGCTGEDALNYFGLLKRTAGRPLKSNSRWDKATMIRIREMRKQKMSWRKIGNVFGVQGATVYRAYYDKGPKCLDDWQAGEE